MLRNELAARRRGDRASTAASSAGRRHAILRRATFERSILDWGEYDAHADHRRLYADLLALRRSDDAFTGRPRGAVDGAVLGAEAFVLHFFTDEPEHERLLVVNFGAELVTGSFAEPLVAPPGGYVWTLRWSSEDPEYGGSGTPEVAGDQGWRIPGHAAVVLKPAVLKVARGGRRED